MNFAVMWENVMKNWETSVPGLITAIAVFAAVFYPDDTMFINKLAAAVAGLSFAIFTLLTKSANVTGTALNPRAQVQGLPTPAPSPTARVEIAAIAEADPALKFKAPSK
jgi:membrane associated rhomboid family serine protease